MRLVNPGRPAKRQVDYRSVRGSSYSPVAAAIFSLSFRDGYSPAAFRRIGFRPLLKRKQCTN